MSAGAVLTTLDWAVIAAYLLFALGVGLYFARRASRNTTGFYLAGRSLPWWIAGTSIVATSFAADTPLVVTGWVRDEGVHFNWIWWGMAVGGSLSFVLFAAWWRRLEVTTDIEVVERRYGGRGAAALRATYGAYHALLTNTVVLGWVLLAMLKLVRVLFGLPEDGSTDIWVAAGCVGTALVYSLTAGLWGVAFTDLFQFVLAMVGAVILAWAAVADVGGLSGLRESLAEIDPSQTQILPRPGPGAWSSASFWTQGFAAFCVLLGLQGWANKNADGGGIGIQRYNACIDENHARKAALWFHIAHYCLRPWPWILVALASLVVLPELADSEAAYPMMMTKYLGPGLLGLMVASFLAAFMSTVDTHFNLASAYFVNDLYRRFLRPNGTERHYVLVGRVSELLVGVLGATLALTAGSIGNLFALLLSLVGGVGPALLLRWFWWRANAWTELSALITSGLATAAVYLAPAAWWPAAPFNGWVDGTTWDHAGRYLLVIGASTAVSIVATHLTAPVDRKTLLDFYRTVTPLGFWAPVRTAATANTPTPATSSGYWALACWIAGLLLIYGLLAGIGGILLAPSELTTHLALLCAVFGLVLLVPSWRRSASRTGRDHLDE